MTYKQCTQTKCVFLRTGEGCPTCIECNAPPQKLCADGSCVNCHCCEGDEGYIRSGKTQRHTIIIAEAIKEVQQ